MASVSPATWPAVGEYALARTAVGRRESGHGASVASAPGSRAWARSVNSPADGGRVVLVVRRPAVGVRELPDEAMLDPVTGLAGDNWLTRGSSEHAGRIG